MSSSMSRGNTGVRIGILSMQGDVAENTAAISGALKDPRGFDGDSVTLVKTPRQVEELDGLVIPGGESTTIGRLSDANKTLEAIQTRIARDDMPVLGICAGLILLAKTADGQMPASGDAAAASQTAAATAGSEYAQPLLGVLDVGVTRNAFGRQSQSFETRLDLSPIAIPDFKGVFIRAPLITRIAPDVTVLCELPRRAGSPGGAVAVSKGGIIGTAFHPELSGDLAVHKHFVAMVRRQKRD